MTTNMEKTTKKTISGKLLYSFKYSLLIVSFFKNPMYPKILAKVWIETTFRSQTNLHVPSYNKLKSTTF